MPHHYEMFQTIDKQKTTTTVILWHWNNSKVCFLFVCKSRINKTCALRLNHICFSIYGSPHLFAEIFITKVLHRYCFPHVHSESYRNYAFLNYLFYDGGCILNNSSLSCIEMRKPTTSAVHSPRNENSTAKCRRGTRHDRRISSRNTDSLTTKIWLTDFFLYSKF